MKETLFLIGMAIGLPFGILFGQICGEYLEDFILKKLKERRSKRNKT